MDDKLVPFMAVLMLALLAGVAYAVFAYWRARRAVAWNIVNAALTWRGLSAGDMRSVEQAVIGMLPGMRMQAQSFHEAGPEIRYALLSMAMHRLGTEPFDKARPFHRLNSPNLARSVGNHIRVVRFRAEMKYGLELKELDAPVGVAISAERH